MLWQDTRRANFDCALGAYWIPYQLSAVRSRYISVEFNTTVKALV